MEKEKEIGEIERGMEVERGIVREREGGRERERVGRGKD